MQQRCFAAAGLKLWNSLPAELRQADISFQQFKRLLKTFLFRCCDRGTLGLIVKAAPHKFYLHTNKTSSTPFHICCCSCVQWQKPAMNYGCSVKEDCGMN